MTMAPEVDQKKSFVPAVLPWAVAAGALILYILTLNHWVTFSSLLPVARTSGWTWQPQLNAPLYWLVTLPFHCLPTRFIPVGLNLLSAVCAALTLGLLVRSVALLPHDRTEEQRVREKSDFSFLSIRTAWLPPLMAAVVCGLQLTFWEQATAASGEMLDLLCFAYVVRCVLEFRVDGRDSWLLRAALVYGAAMTNNWAMIAFLPLFLTALVWVKGLSFFNLRFLTRTGLLLLAGLSLYLLLPLVNALAGGMEVSFWQALKFNLAAQKNFLLTYVFNKGALFSGDRPLWVLALPSLLPMLALAIRWPSYFGDPSPIGVALATLVFHSLYGLLLLVCAWVAMDPQFSYRNYQPGLMHMGILMLPFYYLSALSIGYFIGYFLLVFGKRPVRRRPQPSFQFLNPFVIIGVWSLVAVVSATLVYRNLPQIRLTNGPMLRNFATEMATSLPDKNVTVLSDDPRRLLLLRSVLTQREQGKDCLFLDTASLSWPDYHRFLHQQQPQRWESNPPKTRKAQFEPAELLRLLYQQSQSNALYYLHPSFGYYFEMFYPEAHGLVYQLTAFPTNSLLPRPPAQALFAENQAFWSQADQTLLQPVLRAIRPPPPSRKKSLVELYEMRLHLKHMPNHEAQLLAPFYSRTLDFWGVQLQRHGQLADAAVQFQRALDFNPENVCAKVNLECNANLQAGRSTSVQLAGSMEDQFGRYRSWDQVLGENGPFDEPSFCYEQGRMFVRGGNYRQAAQEFDRVKALAPDNLPSRLWLAQLHVLARLPDEALKFVDEIQSQPARFACGPTNQVELTSVGMAAHLVKNDLPGAEAVVRAALAKSPEDEKLLAVATQVYMSYGRYTNALAMIEQHLRLKPDEPALLLNKGVACLQMKAFEPSVAALTKVVDLDRSNPSSQQYNALFYRALAYLTWDKLTEARADYEMLQKAFPSAYKVYLGLAEIAYRQKDTNAAILNYQRCLANLNTNTAEAKLVNDRLKQLQATR